MKIIKTRKKREKWKSKQAKKEMKKIKQADKKNIPPITTIFRQYILTSYVLHVSVFIIKPSSHTSMYKRVNLLHTEKTFYTIFFCI
jgi:hypothetical protein